MTNINEELVWVFWNIPGLYLKNSWHVNSTYTVARSEHLKMLILMVTKCIITRLLQQH